MNQHRWEGIGNGDMAILPRFCPEGVRVVVYKNENTGKWQVRIESYGSTFWFEKAWVKKDNAKTNAWRLMKEFTMTS